MGNAGLNNLEGGERRFNLQYADLRDILAAAVASRSAKAEERQVTLTTTSDSAFPVRVDEVAIRQIFEDILDNAIHFSPTGETVEIAMDQAEGMAVVEIRDRGIGIPKESQFDLFSGFNVCDLMHHTQGTGLSLAIVQRIAEWHRGDTSLSSEPGECTCFRLRLPLVDPSLASQDADEETICQSR
jgi:signal transduction histidine kinase